MSELSKTLCAAWKKVPSHRIVEDIERIPKALVEIIKAKGSLVPDYDLRHGRRAPRAKGVREELSEDEKEVEALLRVELRAKMNGAA